MNVTPTAGIAAAWSAAKASPNHQAAQRPASRPAETGQASEEAVEPKKGAPAPDGQGTRVDVRV